ncbi:hypothetical protein EPD60_03700 [Flaviaesturariibacter flavus]|uniref:Uncharacterized protein n=1 Tax=Flaviaesturariibacter flavus TaxID=2502780 RepID=A0A4R1BMN4_9BACT|nr:hypothetical protein [Flaviaesturariibacter flavus]TCJ18616.1 hypothetical protein EPD60_03700 [Flaviaesturariibacter flavus]
MGLSIYYQGRIKDRALLPQLVEAVSDICKELNWEHESFNKGGAEGMYFAPEGSEPLSLTFNREGRLTDFRHILLRIELDEPVEGIIVKTQYAGAEAHKAIIDLFRWISEKYLADFQLSDESRYWETGDEAVLLESFERYDLLLNAVARALDTFPAHVYESPEGTAERLARFLQERFGGDVREVRN